MTDSATLKQTLKQQTKCQTLRKIKRAATNLTSKQ